MTKKKHLHYYKDVRHYDYVDVYRIIDLYQIADPCLQHAVKKILCAGGRGAKDQTKDLNEVKDSIDRFFEMQTEDKKKVFSSTDGNVPNASDLPEVDKMFPPIKFPPIGHPSFPNVVAYSADVVKTSNRSFLVGDKVWWVKESGNAQYGVEGVVKRGEVDGMVLVTCQDSPHIGDWVVPASRLKFV